MTQNHELDMDCVADVKINQDTGCNDNYKQQLVNNNEEVVHLVIDDIIKKLLCLSKSLFNSEKKYLQLQHIIKLLTDLEKNLVNENAFIVLELIKSTKKMLLKIRSLELKIDDNNIKVINKCISNLPNLLKQHYDHKLQLDDEVLWCMEVADSITEGNDCFFTKIVYLDNFTSSILFGKEVDNPNSMQHNNNENYFLTNRNNINQLEETSIGNNHFINEIDSNLAIGVNGEIVFLTEASDLAKKLNELFVSGVKHDCLINYSADIINYLNQIKFTSLAVCYNKISFSCYFFAKIYNCIVLFDLDITDRQIVTILAKYHSCFIKQIDSYLDLNEANNKQKLESQMKALYNEFMQLTNLVNDISVASNEDYYNIANNSNFSSLINTASNGRQNDYNLTNINVKNTELFLTQIKYFQSIANQLSQTKENFNAKNIITQAKSMQDCCIAMISNINKIIDENNKIKSDSELNATNNQDDINKIYSFIATYHLQVQLNKIISNQTDKQSNININIKNLYLYSHTYKKIVSIIKKTISYDIHNVLLENNIIHKKNIDNNHYQMNIDTIGVNSIISYKTDKFIFNNSTLTSLAIKHNVISRNQSINKYNRLNVLLATVAKLPQANNSSIIKLYSQIRKIGGNLIIDTNDIHSEFIVEIPNTNVKHNMLILQIQNTICAIPANMIVQAIEPQARNNNKVISLHKKFANATNIDLTKCYILVIESNNAKIELAVDNILGFDNLLVESLPLPFAAKVGINGVAYTKTDDIAFIINPFDYQI